MSNPFSFGRQTFPAKALLDEEAWEEKISSWELPATTTESETIERAARMVRQALSNNAWLKSEGVIVASQGSYWNNTNVRLQADMDIRVVHPTVEVEFAEPYPALSKIGAYKLVPETALQISTKLREEIGKTLNDSFGSQNVNSSGGKAFTISAVSGSRSDIDVVPCVSYDFNFAISNNLWRHTGVAIFDKNTAQQIVNFPEQHYQNGVEKRALTCQRFKKIVRSIKSIRDRFVEIGILEKGIMPSFLIESLVYRVDDVYFLQNDTRRQRLLRILLRIQAMLADPSWVSTAKEINDIKLLFGNHQTWNSRNAQFFIAQAVRFISE